MPTITANIVNSVTEGTKIVLRMSLPTSKSNDNNMPLAKRSLIVSLSIVCSFIGFRNVLKKEIKARIAEIPIINPAAMSIPKVK